MYIVHVFVEVKPAFIEAFKTATLANATASVQEPGITRFDVLQSVDQPDHFTLVEVYRTKEDTGRHKETQHYQIWSKTVIEMMAAPRTKQIYENIYPENEGWE